MIPCLKHQFDSGRLAHSAGSELVLRMATHDRGAGLLGIEISGTGIRQTEAALAVLASAGIDKIPRGLPA